MVWGRTSDHEEHKNRGQAFTRVLPAPREGQIPGHWKSAPTGSRGGAPIWVMAEAWMPKRRSHAGVKGTSLHELMRRVNEAQEGSDPDGFAVFGRYPMGFLNHVLAMQLLGDIRRDAILHVCSGTLGPDEKWTVDVRAEAKPSVQASGTALPFADASFAAVMLDPPYSDQYAKNLYRTENPRPSWLLKEAARVVRPIGRIGMLHVAVPFAPPNCRLLKVYGVSTGVGFRIRAFTVYEREQDTLPFAGVKA